MEFDFGSEFFGQGNGFLNVVDSKVAHPEGGHVDFAKEVGHGKEAGDGFLVEKSMKVIGVGAVPGPVEEGAVECLGAVEMEGREVDPGEYSVHGGRVIWFVGELREYLVGLMFCGIRDEFSRDSGILAYFLIRISIEMRY